MAIVKAMWNPSSHFNTHNRRIETNVFDLETLICQWALLICTGLHNSVTKAEVWNFSPLFHREKTHQCDPESSAWMKTRRFKWFCFFTALFKWFFSSVRLGREQTMAQKKTHWTWSRSLGLLSNTVINKLWGRHLTFLGRNFLTWKLE